MPGPDPTATAFAAIERATVELLDHLERLGAEFHNDERGTRAVVRLEEAVETALLNLRDELGLDHVRVLTAGR